MVFIGQFLIIFVYFVVQESVVVIDKFLCLLLVILVVFLDMFEKLSKQIEGSEIILFGMVFVEMLVQMFLVEFVMQFLNIGEVVINVSMIVFEENVIMYYLMVYMLGLEIEFVVLLLIVE